MIDIRLKVFRSVALNQSFTRASQELFISQPAISKHVKELESEFNCKLFERLAGKIVITPAGQVMLDHANRILKAYERMAFEMNALQQKTTGELRIGASTTVSQYIIPEIIANFRHDFPEITITLLSGNSREVERALEQSRIDLGMVEGISRQPQFKYTAFMDDELVPIVSTRGGLSAYDSIDLETLKRVPIVLREFGSGSLDVIRQAFEKKGISLSELNIEMSLGTTEGIKHYVDHSSSMGIVSIRSVSKEVFNNIFKIVDLDGLKIGRRLAFVERQGEVSALSRKFKMFITKCYNR